jgi:hypothetical protein
LGSGVGVGEGEGDEEIAAVHGEIIAHVGPGLLPRRRPWNPLYGVRAFRLARFAMAAWAVDPFVTVGWRGAERPRSRPMAIP